MIVVVLPQSAHNVKFPYSVKFERYGEEVTVEEDALKPSDTLYPSSTLYPSGDQYTLPCVVAGDFRSSCDVNVAGSDTDDYSCYDYHKVVYTPTTTEKNVLSFTTYFEGTVNVELRCKSDITNTAKFRAKVGTIEGEQKTNTAADKWEFLDLGEFDVKQGDTIVITVQDPTNTNNVELDTVYVIPVDPINVYFDVTEYHLGETRAYDGDSRIFDVAHLMTDVLTIENDIMKVDENLNVQSWRPGYVDLCSVGNDETKRDKCMLRFLSRDVVEMLQKFNVSKYRYESIVRLRRGKPYVEFDKCYEVVTLEVDKSMNKYMLVESTGLNSYAISTGSIALTNVVDKWFAIYQSDNVNNGLWFACDDNISSIEVTDLGTKWKFKITMASKCRYYVGWIVDVLHDINVEKKDQTIQKLVLEAKRRYQPSYRIMLRPE